MRASDLKRGAWLVNPERKVEAVAHLRGSMVEHYLSPTCFGMKPAFDIVLVKTRALIDGDRSGVMTLGPSVSEWFFAGEEIQDAEVDVG